MESLAQKFGVPEIQIEKFAIERRILDLVPPHIARNLRLVPMNVDKDTLILAMENPCDDIAIQQLKELTGLAVEVVVASPSSVGVALDEYYPELLLL